MNEPFVEPFVGVTLKNIGTFIMFNEHLLF